MSLTLNYLSKLQDFLEMYFLQIALSKKNLYYDVENYLGEGGALVENKCRVSADLLAAAAKPLHSHFICFYLCLPL